MPDWTWIATSLAGAWTGMNCPGSEYPQTTFVRSLANTSTAENWSS